MAMAICSSSNHSPSFPNLPFSSYSAKSHLKVTSYSIHSSSSYTCTSLQEDASIIPTARAATALPYKILESKSDMERELQWCNEATIRRRRRRRRRRIKSLLERVNNDDDDDNDNDGDYKALFVDNKPRKSRFMTPKEEATFSWYLKERARIESVRRELIAEMGGNELSTNQWAKAAGISRHKLDRILWNGRESEKKITSCYHGLVVSIASSYQGKGLSIQDLTQEGSIGLLHGAIKFNPERGYKLSTYAYWWIRQSITRAIANKSRIVRLPGSISELMPRICEANNALSRKLRRFPTYEEIAESINVNASSVRLAIERNRPVISLDQAMTSRGYMSLQHIIPGPDEMTPEAMVKKELLKPEIGKLFETLCDREAKILRLHYGLNGESGWSFEEIGRLFKLSRERVRQINFAALSKLKDTNQIHDLNYFI